MSKLGEWHPYSDRTYRDELICITGCGTIKACKVRTTGWMKRWTGIKTETRCPACSQHAATAPAS